MGFKTKFGLQRGQKTVKAKKKDRRRGGGRQEEEREIKKVWILVRFGMDIWISCMEF